jgi:hypothetical protein
MTRAFFMLAGKLPVLMFSFMIRTFVSFCNQEGHNVGPGRARARGILGLRLSKKDTMTQLKLLSLQVSVLQAGDLFRGHICLHL